GFTTVYASRSTSTSRSAAGSVTSTPIIRSNTVETWFSRWAGTWTRCFRPLIDRSRAPLDLKTIKTILGYRHRPIYRRRTQRSAEWEVAVDDLQAALRQADPQDLYQRRTRASHRSGCPQYAGAQLRSLPGKVSRGGLSIESHAREICRCSKLHRSML